MHLHAVYAAEVAIGAGSATFEGHVHQLEIRDAGYFFRHLHTPMYAVVASAAAAAAVSTELGMAP
jgi:hypothetical protein